MRVFLKLAFRNIKRKKLRFFLLFLTFILSALTIMTAVFFKDAAINSRVESFRDLRLNNQILISAKDTKEPYFNASDVTQKLQKIKGIKNMVVRLTAGANINKPDGDIISLVGTDYDEQKKVYQFKLIKSADVEPFAGKAIISKSSSLKYNLQLGSNMEVYYNNKKASFKVVGISEDKGIFAYEGMVFISLKDASKLYDKEGFASSVGITITNLDEISEVYDAIKKSIGSKFEVGQNYDMDYYNAYVGTLSMAINIFAIFAIFITLFLTYSTFKTIIHERISQIGTLRSIGTSKKQVIISIYIENMLIVIFSTFVGILASIPLIKCFLKIITESDIVLEMSYWKIFLIFIGLVAAGLLSILSSISKAMSISIVDIIKGNIKKHSIKNKYPKYITGAILLLLSLLCMVYNEKLNNGLLVLIIGLAAFVISFIVLIELFHRILAVTLFKVFNYFGAEIRLVLKESKRDFSKSSESLILICIVIGIAYLSFVTSFLVKESANKVYSGTDIYLSGINSTDGIADKISKIDGVQNVVQQLRTKRNIDGIDVEISGVDPDKYKPVSFEIFKKPNKDYVFGELNRNRNIIVTTTFSKSTNKKIGDYVEIKTGNNSFNYKIIGICSSFENMGKVLFISKDNYINDIASNNYILYLIKIKNGYIPDLMVKRLESKLNENEYSSITTLKQMMEYNNEQNEKIFLIVNILFFISAFVSIICLNNNLIINILTRTRVYAIERTIGMSKCQLFKVILGEGVLLCIEGGILGLVLGYIMNLYLVRILAYYIGDLTSSINYIICIVLLVASVIIGLLSAIYPYRKLCKMNIVQSIKGVE